MEAWLRDVCCDSPEIRHPNVGQSCNLLVPCSNCQVMSPRICADTYLVGHLPETSLNFFAATLTLRRV